MCQLNCQLVVTKWEKEFTKILLGIHKNSIGDVLLQLWGLTETELGTNSSSSPMSFCQRQIIVFCTPYTLLYIIQ